ncbi:hypothetical protein JCGZ_13791 [Jatropha curcas]|uniref:Zinc finger PHD-type domain-containing protein n=1 Tax=Jatropha curcas TaxID=180498 RepID=A0A067K762_JATCU|nr:hypothetical protein JCGZ_13791 [Jatropha curcas]
MAPSDEEGEILPKHVSSYYFVDSKDVPVSFTILPVQWDGKRWLILQQPRKVFEHMIRDILITVHWLHFIKKNPDACERSVWNHLQRTFSSYEVPPSEDDLLNQKLLIKETAGRDEELQASKDAQTTKIDNDDHNEEENIFDKVCAICDDGGDILCCNGRCLRSFHPTVADGLESHCASLGFRNKAEYEAIQMFLCNNCRYEQHQCFACGRLGFSAKSASQQVFPCASATCGHFYHPECVARLLHIGNKIEAGKILRAKIAAGESFVCPAHKCFICKQREVAEIKEMQFAMCRRCPKAYHRNCLPRDIVFGHDSNTTNLQRAWEGLLPNGRILIYCMEHEIDRQLSTPLRDHLLFPNDERTHTSNLELRQRKLVISKRSKVSEGLVRDRTSMKKRKKVKQNCDEIGGFSKMYKRFPSQDFECLKKSNIIDRAKTELEKNVTSVSAMSIAEDTSSIIFRNKSPVNSRPYPPKTKVQNVSSSKIEITVPDKPLMKKVNNSSPLVDIEMEKRILALMDHVDSSFDIGKFTERNNPNTHLCCSRTLLDKSITLGLVEGSVKSKLKIYLAPFLHGARYTSYGRHFTQETKINEIVDFCCGSNDFSCLLKEKLEKTEKTCLFKNYDIIQAKNDFCFEKKDWLKVSSDELSDGSRLIMGLNPPFGVKASLSNTFINKALEFKPKLLILITPKETERLDRKAPYNLIWEDEKLLSGKAFYLPGSVDVNDKQMEDWNLSPPPLYLWSRADWTPLHRAIARQYGHL